MLLVRPVLGFRGFPDFGIWVEFSSHLVAIKDYLSYEWLMLLVLIVIGIGKERSLHTIALLVYLPSLKFHLSYGECPRFQSRCFKHKSPLNSVLRFHYENLNA